MEDRALIVEVLARYLHATDAHNGHEAAALFTPSCVLAVHVMGDGSHTLVDEIMGVELVEYALTHFLPVPPAGMSSRRMSSDHVVTIRGDTASLRASFCIVTSGLPEMSEDTAPNAAFARRFGQIIQSGFFLIDLVRTDGAWKIARFAVYNDIPGQGMPLTREPPRA